MVWAAISYHGPSSIDGIDGNMESKFYCNDLEEALILKVSEVHGDAWILVQDNASAHLSKYTKSWLESQDVQVLPWTAKSPDLNKLEDVWGMMASHVCAHGSQFADINGLISAIQIAWSNISSAYIKKLYASIPRRLISVVRKNGEMTDYEAARIKLFFCFANNFRFAQ